MLSSSKNTIAFLLSSISLQELFYYYHFLLIICLCDIDSCSRSNISIPDKMDDPLEVRLVNSTAPNAGRVEVKNAGVWGTIWGYRWDSTDATVVCRMLGYDIGYILYFYFTLMIKYTVISASNNRYWDLMLQSGSTRGSMITNAQV